MDDMTDEELVEFYESKEDYEFANDEDKVSFYNGVLAEMLARFVCRVKNIG